MSNPALLSLAFSNGFTETDDQITAALEAHGYNGTDVEFEVSSLDAIHDREEGGGVKGFTTTPDGRMVESATWTAEEIKSRHGFHRAGVPIDDVRRCFDNLEEAEAFLRAVEPVK